MNLRLDWVDAKAARYACEKWHYSKTMPCGKLMKLGVWENSRFVGVVIFGMGASPPFFKRISKWLGVGRFEACELVRVAMTKHETQVSRIIAIALAMLRRHCPNLKLVVSFADADQGHHGGIYQAGNWIYTGLRNKGHRYGYRINGRTVHCRSMPGLGLRNTLADARKLDPRAEVLIGNGKHQYWYPFSDDVRCRLVVSSIPYPKRAGSIGSDAAAVQVAQGGATPTSALSVISE